MKALDREGTQILWAFEAGKLKSTVITEAPLRRYREYARATLSKNKRVNIRLSTPDLSEIQARAAEEGIPYQTLIASVLHKFVAGRFVEKSSQLTARSTGRGRNVVPRSVAVCSRS
jgi:predicted DNA binding CopG/RHH family protein